MKRNRIVCLALMLVAASATGAALAAKPGGGGGGGGTFNCKWVVCANPDCGDGYHTEIPAGACCPVCVPN
jgi:hypothetical protein